MLATHFYVYANINAVPRKRVFKTRLIAWERRFLVVKLVLNMAPFRPFRRSPPDINVLVEAETSGRDDRKHNENVLAVGPNRTCIGILLGTGVRVRNSVQVPPPSVVKVDTHAEDIGDESQAEEHLTPGEKERYSQTRLGWFIAVTTLEPPLQRPRVFAVFEKYVRHKLHLLAGICSRQKGGGGASNPEGSAYPIHVVYSW